MSVMMADRDVRQVLDPAPAARSAPGVVERLETKPQVEQAPKTKSMKFWETDPDAWAKVIETNVVGTYYMSRVAAPHLIRNGWGRIVNVTTSLPTMQRRHNSPYGVSKAAMMVMPTIT